MGFLGFGEMEPTAQTDSSGTTRSTSTGTSKSTSTVKLPEWVTQGAQDVFGLAMDNANTPTAGYGGTLTADMSPDQIAALSGIASFQGANVLDESLGGARDYAAAPAQTIRPEYGNTPAGQISGAYTNAGPQQVGTERIVDENGQLGSFADYFNSYTGATLDPTIRRIQEAADAARLQQRASSTMANAYGDARHGIVDTGIDDKQFQNVGDITNKTYADAWSQAMGLRGADLNRFLQADVANAGFGEQALERMFKGQYANANLNEAGLERGFKSDQAQGQFNEEALKRQFEGSGALLDRASQDQATQLQALQAKLAAGGVLTEHEQAASDRLYNEFMRQYEGDQSSVKDAASILASLPIPKTVKTSGRETTRSKGTTTGTSTTEAPDNSGFDLIGSVLGALI